MSREAERLKRSPRAVHFILGIEAFPFLPISGLDTLCRLERLQAVVSVD
jgi:hypothetical protein